MRRSKLEVYVDILKVLVQRGPLKLTHIMYKTNMNCSVLSQDLAFLVKQRLVQERKVGKNKVVYASTSMGKKVLSSFRELNQALPIIVEEDKNLPIAY
jgi:predicted transcriptional regulator